MTELQLERADTDEKKEDIMKQLLELWKELPDLRLGQLLIDAETLYGDRGLFYTEDYDLVRNVRALEYEYELARVKAEKDTKG